MAINGVSIPEGSAYAVKIQSIANDQAKVEGKQTVALIEQSSPPPPGGQGQGTHINTYA